MKLWLLHEDTIAAMHAAPPLTAAQQDQAAAAFGDFKPKAERVLTVAGSVAQISVSGVLTSAPDFMAYFFGGGNTLYGDIIAAIDQAEADPRVKSVEFYYDTPGGEAQPVAAVGDKIYDMKKRNTAYVRTAASAGYWLASQSQKIVAENRASRAGSIGAVRRMVRPDATPFQEVTSSGAPFKRPDISTESGMAAVKAELDGLEDLFVTAVALGRDTTKAAVLESYGKGAMLLAGDALKAGMIDKVADKAPKKRPISPTKTTGAKAMDLATLKAEHPALYAQVLAEGQKTGAAAEMDRVKFHLKMGENCGCMDVAAKACAEGTAKDDGEVLATYLSAGRNKDDLQSRIEDSDKVDDNKPAASEQDDKATATNAIFSAAAQQCGVDLEG